MDFTISHFFLESTFFTDLPAGITDRYLKSVLDFILK